MSSGTYPICVDSLPKRYHITVFCPVLVLPAGQNSPSLTVMCLWEFQCSLLLNSFRLSSYPYWSFNWIFLKFKQYFSFFLRDTFKLAPSCFPHPFLLDLLKLSRCFQVILSIISTVSIGGSVEGMTIP